MLFWPIWKNNWWPDLNPERKSELTQFSHFSFSGAKNVTLKFLALQKLYNYFFYPKKKLHFLQISLPNFKKERKAMKNRVSSSIWGPGLLEDRAACSDPKAAGATPGHMGSGFPSKQLAKQSCTSQTHTNTHLRGKLWNKATICVSFRVIRSNITRHTLILMIPDKLWKLYCTNTNFNVYLCNIF